MHGGASSHSALQLPTHRRARRPFHPGRLWDLLRRYWVLQQVDSLGDTEDDTDGPSATDGQPQAALEDGRAASAANGKEGQRASAPAAEGSEEDGDTSTGPVIVAEAVTAAEAGERQAALKRQFGQVGRWGVLQCGEQAACCWRAMLVYGAVFELYQLFCSFLTNRRCCAARASCGWRGGTA